MLTVNDYIKLILKKKKWTNVQFCEKLNELEAKFGDSRTTPQNITNYLNGYWAFRPKVLVKYEVVLGLPLGTLINMVEQPKSKEGQKELKETIKKVRNLN